jgi:glucuronokinase
MEAEKWVYLLVTTTRRRTSINPAKDSPNFFDEFTQFKSLPPALYPIGGVPLIDTWLQKLSQSSASLSEIYLITNQNNHSKFAEWGQSRSLPYQNILISNSSIDDLTSLKFLIQEHEDILQNKHIMIILADSLIDCDFSLTPFLCQTSDGMFASWTGNSETFEPNLLVNDRNLLLPDTSLHQGYTHHLASVYSLPSSCYAILKSLPDSITTTPDLLRHLSREIGIIFQTPSSVSHYYPMSSLSNYDHASSYFENYSRETFSHLPDYVNIICPARAGLMGNPSDGFHGKTLSFIVNNFYAQVTITANPTLAVQLIPHPVFDITHFASFDTLHKETQLNVPMAHSLSFSSSSSFVDVLQGYYGGLRLLKATCRSFARMCCRLGLLVHMQRGFTISYDTTIPRRVPPTPSLLHINLPPSGWTLWLLGDYCRHLQSSHGILWINLA